MCIVPYPPEKCTRSLRGWCFSVALSVGTYSFTVFQFLATTASQNVECSILRKFFSSLLQKQLFILYYNIWLIHKLSLDYFLQADFSNQEIISILFQLMTFLSKMWDFLKVFKRRGKKCLFFFFKPAQFVEIARTFRGKGSMNNLHLNIFGYPANTLQSPLRFHIYVGESTGVRRYS